METRSHETPVKKINQDHIWQQVNEFSNQVSHGFPDKEAELETYANLIGTTLTFFDQPDTAGLSTAEVGQFVETFFCHQEEYVPLPIDIFVRIGDGITNTDLPFNKIILSIQETLKQEYIRATQELHEERQDRETLTKLASKSHPESAPPLIEPSFLEKQNEVKQTVIDQLAQNEELEADVQKKDTCLSVLRQMQQETPSSESIQNLLSPYSEFFDRNGKSGLDDLYLHASLGHLDYVNRKIDEYVKKLENPDFIWNQWVKKDVIPQEISAGFGQIMAFYELSQIAQQTRTLSPETTAAALLPFLEKGIGASLLMEIVRGNFEVTDNLLIREISTFLDFSKNYQDGIDKPHVKKWSLKNKIAASLVAAALIASPYIYKNFINPVTQTQITVENVSDESLANESVTSAGDSESGTGSPDFIKPKNSSPESFEKAQNEILWFLKGKDLAGVYKTDTASYFDPQQKAWYKDKNTIAKQTLYSPKTDITLSTTLMVDNQIIKLPLKDKYLLTQDSVKIGGSPKKYPVYQNPNGEYFIKMSDYEFGRYFEVTYSIGKSDKPVSNSPSPEALEQASQKYIEIGDLPQGGLKDLMQKLSQNNKSSDLTKAKEIEKYIKKNFLYSLDPSASDLYHRQKDVKSFINQIVRIRQTDCDVANTVLVMMLRTQGIPARMAFGLAHDNQSINPNENIITAAEGHGWTEAYIAGQWIPLDATPTSMDSTTKKALKDMGLKLDSGELLGDASSLSNWLNEETATKGLLIMTGVNLAALAASTLLRRRNNQAVERLEEEFNRRVKAYWGPQFPGIHHVLDSEDRKFIANRAAGYPSIFASIPPFGLINLGHDIKRYRKIQNLPYALEADQIPQSPQPSSFEFLTKILGYSEKDVKKQLLVEAYQSTRDQIARQSNNLVDRFSVNERFRFPSHLRKSLKKLEKPVDSESWASTTRALTEKLYRNYSREYNGYQKKQERKRAKKITPRLSHQEFKENMSQLYHLRLLGWKLKEEYSGSLRHFAN